MLSWDARGGRVMTLSVEVVEKELGRINEDIRTIKSDAKDLSRDVRALETRTVVNEQNIKTIGDDVRSIKSDTKWILRLIVATLVLGTMGLLMKGVS